MGTRMYLFLLVILDNLFSPKTHLKLPVNMTFVSVKALH